MNYRAWNVLCWNIRGLNDRDKWHSIRNKIEESCANIFCLQETKREIIDLQFFVILPLKDLIVSILAPRLGLLGEFLSAGPPIISQVALLKSTLLP
jgi:hypothetical protein